MEVSKPLQETLVLTNQRLSKSLETVEKQSEDCLESGEIVEDGDSLKVIFKAADEQNDGKGISGQHTGCGESESLACATSKFKNGLDKYVFVHGNGEDQNPQDNVSSKSRDACVWAGQCQDDQEPGKPGDVQTNELKDQKTDAQIDDEVSEDVENATPGSPFLPIHNTERNGRVCWHNLSRCQKKVVSVVLCTAVVTGCILGVVLNSQSDQPSTGGMDDTNNKTWTEFETTETQPVLPRYHPKEQPEEDKECKTVIMQVWSHSEMYGSIQICRSTSVDKRHQCEVDKKHWSCVPDDDNKWFGVCTLELPKIYHVGEIECCCPIMSQRNLEARVMYKLCPCGMNNQ